MREPKMRELEKREQLPDDYNALDVYTSRAIEYFSAPEFYGKFRAYLFVNFAIIAVGMIVCVIRCFSEGEGETAMGFVTMAALLAGFCCSGVPWQRKPSRKSAGWSFSGCSLRG